MFTERLNELLDEACRTTSGELARIGQYDRSYVTHLRRGDRVLKPGRKAAERLARAVYLCACERGETERLRRWIGAEADRSGEELCGDVLDWLFEGLEKPAQRPGGRAIQPLGRGLRGSFGTKLSAAMELANISNLRLARALNVDVSVIGKYRSGLRVPRVNHPLIHEIGLTLAARILSLGKLAELSRLTGAEPSEDEAESARQLENWLRDFNTVDTSLIESLLDDVDHFSPDTQLPLPPPEEAAEREAADTAERYEGIAGLRRAVLRFLGRAVADGRRQLLLYSDQSMDWMTEDADFTGRWMSLMSAYVRGGGRVCMVHHVERGLEELLAAIRSWLPLYMSGGIESRYCLRRGGERFSHTLFLEPEGGCISGCYVFGKEDNARYRYDTEAGALRYYRREFDDLLADCRPLLRMESPGTLPDLGRGDEVHLVGNTLSLFTMPAPLLRHVLSRSALPEELRSRIAGEWEQAGAAARAKLAEGGVVHECVPLPDEETLFSLRVRVDTDAAALYYTPEEYAEHVRGLLELTERSPGYRFHPLSDSPFCYVRMAASEHSAFFGHTGEHPMAFSTAHPLICRAAVNFAKRLEEQYAGDRLTLREQLKRYL